MVITSNHYRWDFIGLSTDSKPTPETSQKVCNGSTFYEADTSAFYIYYNDQWYLKQLAGTGTTYIPLTLAYISYGRADVAQRFADLIVAQDTAPVGGASYAFANTTGLTTLDLSDINFSNVTDTVCMFDGAANLTSITWANSVNFGNVETMEGMYRGTTALTSVDLSKFDTGEYLESLFNMFASSGVQSVDLGAPFDTSAVTDFYGMFNSCTALTDLYHLNNLRMDSATNVGAMFYNCSAMTELDLGEGNRSNSNNLIQIVGTTSNGLTSSNQNGILKISGEAADNWAFVVPETSSSLSAGEYTLSIDNSLSHSVDVRFYFNDETNQTYVIGAGNTTTTFTTTKPANKYAVLFGGITNGQEYDEAIKLQLELGSTASPWQPYSFTPPTLSLSVANADYMLAGMTSLQSLDLSGWKSGSDDLASSNFWTAQSALTTLTLNGNKRLVDGKVSDSIMATFSSKQGDTITNLTINDPVYYTTDGTTAELTNLADIWGGNALTTLEMTGWDLSDVNPAGNPASTSFNSLANLTTLTIGDFTLPTNGVNLAMIIGVENTGNSYTSGAPLLANLHLTGDSVMKVYNSGTGTNKSQNVFAGNPIGNGTGHIYVPADLVNSYKSDSFWSNYSAIIVAED